MGYAEWEFQMKGMLAVLLMLGLIGAVQAEDAPPSSPEAMIGEIVSADDLRFFLNEARQAARLVARGERYVPSPEAATRAKDIGNRIQKNGLDLVENLLDQIEHELLKAMPEQPDRPTVPCEPPDRLRT
jgi:hypothetical protein